MNASIINNIPFNWVCRLYIKEVEFNFYFINCSALFVRATSSNNSVLVALFFFRIKRRTNISHVPELSRTGLLKFVNGFKLYTELTCSVLNLKFYSNFWPGGSITNTVPTSCRHGILKVLVNKVASTLHIHLFDYTTSQMNVCEI